MAEEAELRGEEEAREEKSEGDSDMEKWQW
jgi:hypothetical protein